MAALFLLVGSTSAQVRIASMHPIIGDLARQIGGEHVDVVDLIPPGGDPHHFDPTPDTLKQVASVGLVLASGICPVHELEAAGVRVGLGVDGSASNDGSNMIQETRQALLLQRLHTQQRQAAAQGASDVVDSAEVVRHEDALRWATLGGAQSLDCDDVIGNFAPGKEADFVVLDKQATPFLDFRFQQCKTLLEELFVLATLGDDRNVFATYAAGQAVHYRDAQTPDTNNGTTP